MKRRYVLALVKHETNTFSPIATPLSSFGHGEGPAYGAAAAARFRGTNTPLAAYLDIAKREGATLAAGGERVERATPGFYLTPAVLTHATNDMRSSREEIFGPVASVIRARDYDEALAIANDSPMGLSSGVVTTSLKSAAHFKRNAQAGMVMVNVPTAGVDYHVPFGGRKASSFGPREQGRYAAEFYTTVKTAYVGA